MKNISRTLLFVISFLHILVCSIQAQVVSTHAGTGTPGLVNGPSNTAQFNYPTDVALGASGDIYVSEEGNTLIRKITSGSVVSTYAGSGVGGFVNGPASTAQFNKPNSVAVDAAGNLYVADFSNHCIRKVTPSGTVSTFAGTGTIGYVDGPGNMAQFNTPQGVAVDASGNVYVADKDNHRIRKITPSGVVSTLAGSGTQGFADGSATAAMFDRPNGLDVDTMGNVLVADEYNNRIRKITPSGVVSTIAGTGGWSYVDGPGNVAQFKSPRDVAVDVNGNLYVADALNHRIRKISPTAMVTTLAGSGVIGTANGVDSLAQFYNPKSVAVDDNGDVYVADFGNHLIRKISVGAPTGMHELSAVINDIVLYPNPTTDVLYIQAEFAKSLDLQLRFVDVQGRTIYQSSQRTQIGKNTLSLNLSTLVSGHYTVHISENGVNTYNTTFVKQ